VLVASILHYGRHTVDEIKRYLAAHDVAVRARQAA
jgi:imidazole glycerol phosphate synthase subunit HisF